MYVLLVKAIPDRLPVLMKHFHFTNYINLWSYGIYAFLSGMIRSEVLRTWIDRFDISIHPITFETIFFQVRVYMGRHFTLHWDVLQWVVLKEYNSGLNTSQ